MGYEQLLQVLLVLIGPLVPEFLDRLHEALRTWLRPVPKAFTRDVVFQQRNYDWDSTDVQHDSELLQTAISAYITSLPGDQHCHLRKVASWVVLTRATGEHSGTSSAMTAGLVALYNKPQPKQSADEHDEETSSSSSDDGMSTSDNSLSSSDWSQGSAIEKCDLIMIPEDHFSLEVAPGIFLVR